MAETVTKAIFEAEERGVAKTGAALDRLAGSAGKASAAEAGFAKTSQTVANDLRGVEARIEGVNKRLAGAPAAWSRYESSMRAANDGLKAGRIDAEQFGRTVRDLQSELQRVIAPKVDMSAVDSGLARTLGNTEKFGAAQRILARDMLATAQARKTADAEAARGQAMLVEQAQKLRLEIDPLAAAQTRLNTELAEYQALAARGLITTEELGQATAMANGRFEDMGRRLGAVGTQARLTQNQLLNLSRQGNDVLTMGAMGMPLSMIVATQAGQIYGALEENSRGVRGSIEAIGSSIAGFARAIPPAALAVAGLSAAVGGLYLLTRGPSARSAEESVKSFEDAVASLEAAWKGAGDAAEMHYQTARRSGDVAAAALLNVGGNIRELQADLQATIRDLNTSDMLSAPIIWQSSSEQSAARREITALYAEARVGKISVSDLADEMLRIRLDPNIDSHARAFAEEIRRALRPAEELERRIQALNVAAAQMAAPSGTTGRYALPTEVADGMFGRPGSNGRFGDGMADIRSGLEAQTAELIKAGEAARQYADSVATMRTSLRETVDGLQMQIDYFGQSEGALAAATFRTNALAEAQRAATEAGVGQVAPELIAFIEQQAAQVGVLTDRVNGLREAEQERAKAQQEIEAQAKRVTDAYAELQFQGSLFGMSAVEQDVARQLNQLGLTAQSLQGQKIADQIRLNGELEETEDRLEQQRDLMSNIVSTGFDALFDTGSADSFFDRVMDGLADIGRQFAELGKQKLMETLFGGALGYTGGQPSPGQRSIAQPGFSAGILQPANQNLPASAFVPTPTAATRQASQRLAQGVTTAVSRDLLSSMLSAGKSQTHVSGLNNEFAVALTNMFSEAPAAVRSATNIYSGFRSVERQAELFRGAVAKYGSEQAARRWVAPPGNSQHNRGMAADLSYGNSAARQWIHANAGKYGLAFPLGHENWHIELLGARRGGARSAVQAASNVQAGVGGSFAIPQLPVYAAPQMSSAAQQAMAQGWGGFGPTPEQTRLFGQHGRLSQFMQSPLGMGGMNAFGAFGAGQQGGVMSGAMTGGLGAIGMGLGPVGIIGGAVAGVVGSMHGRRAVRHQTEGVAA